MARLPRSNLSDGIYHAYASAVAGWLLFEDDDDRRFFLALFARTVHRFDWTIHAFSLLGTHYHTVVECIRENLSNGMQHLNGRYAEGYNDKYARRGHVFGHRFGSRLIETEDYLAQAIEYVLQNAVAAGLCARAEDWPWSGAPGGAAGSPTSNESRARAATRPRGWTYAPARRAARPAAPRSS